MRACDGAVVLVPGGNDENCDQQGNDMNMDGSNHLRPHQHQSDENSSEQEDVIEDGSTTSRKAVSLAGKKQEKTCAMEAPIYRLKRALELCLGFFPLRTPGFYFRRETTNYL